MEDFLCTWGSVLKKKILSVKFLDHMQYASLSQTSDPVTLPRLASCCALF